MGEDRSIRFGVLCRLTEQKGISYLLEAIRMFRDKYGDVDFTFAGQGDLDGMIRDFVSENNLTNVRIRSVESAGDVFKDIDVFVHPSIGDAMPVSIAEALMFGCPCIVCDVGGVADLVRDEKEGLVIKPRQTDQILESMIRFREMPADEFSAFQERARERYEEVCRPESVGKVIAEYYNTIVDGGISR